VLAFLLVDGPVLPCSAQLGVVGDGKRVALYPDHVEQDAERGEVVGQLEDADQAQHAKQTQVQVDPGAQVEGELATTLTTISTTSATQLSGSGGAGLDRCFARSPPETALGAIAEYRAQSHSRRCRCRLR
jgi:hypothetical protein